MFAMMVAMAAAAAAKTGTSFIESEQQKQALETEMQEEKVAQTARSVQRQKKLNQVLGAQAVQAASKGIDITQGSLRMAGRQSIENFNQDQNLDALNTSMREMNLKEKLHEARINPWLSFINTASTSAMQAQNLQTPSSGSQASTSGSQVSTPSNSSRMDNKTKLAPAFQGLMPEAQQIFKVDQ